MSEKSAYAKAGVDYTQMEPFKMAMIEAGKKTLKFPNKRGVFINEDAAHAHGAVFEYRGSEKHIWCKTQEDLGNKNWIAEWMYERTGKTYYDAIAIDTALIVVNDVIAQGAMPVVFTDQLEASESAWYADDVRAKDLAAGFLKVCEEVGMALPAGESASVKYIVNPTPPVKQIATIIGATSSGLHANGISLIIEKALELPEQFLTKLTNGKTLGEEALLPARSYVALVEALLDEGVEIHTLLPGTGDGVGKIAFDKRPFTYHIRDWPKVPELFRYYHEELQVAIGDCLKTFNWGVGYYIFASNEETERIIKVGTTAGYGMTILGVVEKGERQVIFEPASVILSPPGE